MERKYKKTNTTTGEPKFDAADGCGAIPVTVKVITERQLTDTSAMSIPMPPAGMCLDIDAMEEDESGEDTTVMFTQPKAEDETSAGEPERVELVTSGELRISDGRAELVWHDCQVWGAVEEAVSFDTAMPEVVTLRRVNKTAVSMLLEAMGNTSEPELAFVLERGRRHICLYRAGRNISEIAVRAFRVENSLLRRGAMLLDFSVEIHGVRAEKTRMLIRMRKNEQTRRPSSAQVDTIGK